MRGSPNRPRATNERECTCSKFGIGSSRIARSVSPRHSRVRRLPRRRPSRRAEPLGASATLPRAQYRPRQPQSAYPTEGTYVLQAYHSI
ncbi:hypothetical protein HSBGL_4031 (plasmid) [Halapricum desulfuricans]|uniref:Uncharacterized protein n=1 Tax=Halapricum desulfuricans TaxID=2841257 RepID=A0A897NPP5_9EURY|nr:hypothetical protein HSBGL_4031 [Halapricum desulfuricans]